MQFKTLSGILNSSLIIILIAMGEMFVLLTAGIDVSVGAITGLSAVFLGLSLNNGISVPVAILFAIVIGLAAGAVNGIGVGILKVPPIIMTLGTLGVFRGMMYILTGGSWIDNVPAAFKSLSGLKLANIGVFAWIVLALAIGATILTKKNRHFRTFYYIGDSEDGAYFMGIKVRTGLIMAYVLSGFFSALAGIVFVSQVGFIPMQTGSGQEMRAIAACVLGGISLMGGMGVPLGAFVGGLFLTTIDSLLVFIKVPAYWNYAIAGAILLLVVLVDYRFRTVLEEGLRLSRARFSKNSEQITEKRETDI